MILLLLIMFSFKMISLYSLISLYTSLSVVSGFTFPDNFKCQNIMHKISDLVIKCTELKPHSELDLLTEHCFKGIMHRPLVVSTTHIILLKLL